ncbi:MULTISPECIES: hypothetical protein [unclassified Polaribacter]|uniref:hypothetical protein n=1 Tax=unclassified Polaribacter TaxID=196858 RepID=UPI0011BFDE31|nr:MULTISPECIES: hypothetical protein [unclassified Polaribacter]TXD54187.1 hypothetical protein ES043_01430 [Polaribacter sp. IC063]TXD62452.1 hypothetical protein ES044_01640 [Polaribacter sp. IC066]
MKTSSIAILLFILMFSSCSEKTKAPESSCYPNNKRPSEAITYEEMSAMMDTYEKGAKKELNKYMKKISGGKDSISTNYNWYKLDELKQYIAYIERISKEKDIEVTGFRIYPTSYPKNYSIEDLQGRQTLIFTPTTKIGLKEDVAFEPLYSEKGKPVGISKFLKQVRAKKAYKDTLLLSTLKEQTGLKSSSANRIKPNPPY